MKFPLTIDSIHNNYEIFYKEKLFPTFDYTKLINIQEEIVKNYYNFVKSEIIKKKIIFIRWNDFAYYKLTLYRKRIHTQFSEEK